MSREKSYPIVEIFNSVQGEGYLENSTLTAYLDTTPPETRVYGNSTLLNNKEMHLNFEKLSLKNDLLNYDLYVLVNDGINFAEWEYIGTYNQSLVSYEGIDGYKYRFKTVSRDLYGNIETKNGYDYELRIVTARPQSYF